MRLSSVAVVLAAVTVVSACSTPAPSPAPPSPPRSAAPSSRAPDVHARQWVDDFCTRPANTERYLSYLPSAAEMYPSSTPSEMQATQQVAAQSVRSIATYLRENAATVKGSPTSGARDRLSAIYTELATALDQDQHTVDDLPTSDYGQFKSALHAAADGVHNHVERARQAIAADPELGGFMADHPICS